MLKSILNAFFFKKKRYKTWLISLFNNNIDALILKWKNKGVLYVFKGIFWW